MLRERAASRFETRRGTTYENVEWLEDGERVPDCWDNVHKEIQQRKSEVCEPFGCQ